MYLSEKEKERRYGLVRQAMVEQDFDVLLVVGNGHATGNPRFSTGSFRYLTDFFIFSLYGVLLFFREEDPVMLVPMELQETMAKKYSWVRDVRIGLDYGKIVAEILETKKLHSGKVGIVSMDSLPASTYLSLCERLPGADFADAASLVLPLMFVKGEEERALMQRAAEINDAAYQEALKNLRPGLREFEVAGIIEGYHRVKGADKTFNLVFSGTFPVTKEGVPFQGLPWCPGQKVIEEGDCVHLELTTVYGGYWNQLIRVISVGRENRELNRFHEAALSTLQAGLKTAKAGSKMTDFFNAMARRAEECGFKLTEPMGHFAGLDLIEARVEGRSPVILEPGVAMILHPRIDDSKGTRIILWGETYFMTPEGPVSLNKADNILHIV